MHPMRGREGLQSRREGRHPCGSAILVAMKQYTLLSDWTLSTDLSNSSIP